LPRSESTSSQREWEMIKLVPIYCTSTKSSSMLNDVRSASDTWAALDHMRGSCLFQWCRDFTISDLIVGRRMLNASMAFLWGAWGAFRDICSADARGFMLVSCNLGSVDLPIGLIPSSFLGDLFRTSVCCRCYGHYGPAVRRGLKTQFLLLPTQPELLPITNYWYRSQIRSSLTV